MKPIPRILGVKLYTYVELTFEIAELVFTLSIVDQFYHEKIRALKHKNATQDTKKILITILHRLIPKSSQK